MTTDRLHPQDEAALAALFDDLRDQTPAAPKAYLRRVMADADAILAQPAPVPARRAAGGGGWRAWLRAPFGQAAGGLVTAAVIGFGIGLSGAISGASWLGQAAPLLFETESDTALTLLPEADSFVIALSEDAEVTP
ncbi:hypothetical protein ACEYYB_03770 [Paracoccus sp. p4-l81]|uniref:hypothetical protein n=1 Tax=Paracoccus sp. p4-l81 TaxID=3342806 RepID=UPI0035B7BB0C